MSSPNIWYLPHISNNLLSLFMLWFYPKFRWQERSKCSWLPRISLRLQQPSEQRHSNWQKPTLWKCFCLMKGDSSADYGGRNLRNFVAENFCLRLGKLGTVFSHRRGWRGSGGEDGLLSVGEQVRRHLQTATLLAFLLCYLSYYS